MGGGGAMKNFGYTVMENCAVTGNSIYSADGAGIYNGGKLWLTNCTFSGNTNGYQNSPAGGGAIFNTGTNATLYMTDCTVVSNSAGAAGPGAAIQGSGGATIYAQNCIIANNRSNDVSGTLISQGHNLIRNTNGCVLTGDVTGNLYGVDPLVGPLQNNGGLTLTHALLAGSPAIDAGPANAAPYFDQRGVPRPSGAADDIGAFEYGAVPGAALLSLKPTGDGCFNVNFAGIAGFNYTIQRAPSPSGPWSPVASAMAGADGTGVCLDTNAPATAAFYRTVYP